MFLAINDFFDTLYIKEIWLVYYLTKLVIIKRCNMLESQLNPVLQTKSVDDVTQTSDGISTSKPEENVSIFPETEPETEANVDKLTTTSTNPESLKEEAVKEVEESAESAGPSKAENVIDQIIELLESLNTKEKAPIEEKAAEDKEISLKDRLINTISELFGANKNNAE